MKIIVDRQALRTRANRAQVARLGGQLAMLASVAILMYKPQLQILAVIILVVGFAVSIFGINYANRWVKKPRLEASIDLALKGLSDQFCLYHYVLPVEHVLLTPSAVVVLETCSLEGVFSYKDGKWRQRMSMSRALRYPVEEKLGDPIARAQAGADLIKARLTQQLPENARVPVHAMVVFTHPNVELQVENPPVPVCQPVKLASRLPKAGAKLPPDIYQNVQALLVGKF